jgi:Protein of unknown function (DUF3710)
VKFNRKSRSGDASVDELVDGPADGTEVVEEVAATVEGPHDIADVDIEDDGIERVDLGGLVLAPVEGLEVRLQVDQATEAVQSVMYAGPEGGVEVRAFASSRNEDLWPDVRRQIAADIARRGGTATEVDGRWGTELVCQSQVTTPEGKVGRQDTRVVGITGPRWFLRVTYIGQPAVESVEADVYDRAVTSVVVRRGSGPMAPGDPLPLALPAQARRVQG